VWVYRYPSTTKPTIAISGEHIRKALKQCGVRTSDRTTSAARFERGRLSGASHTTSASVCSAIRRAVSPGSTTEQRTTSPPTRWQQWADDLDTLTSGSNVVAIKRA